jgi:hypothetical protein
MRRGLSITLALSLLASLAACRDRGNNTPAPSTTVPTQVPPLQPPAPIVAAPNALADAAVVAAPNALADAAVAQPAAPAEPAAPAAARTNTGSNDTVNIPSPVNGVPGVRVRRGSNTTTVNVGGIRLNLPTQ